ncbi:hypothetical protein R6Q59_029218 [Mikania micrantha]
MCRLGWYRTLVSYCHKLVFVEACVTIIKNLHKELGVDLTSYVRVLQKELAFDVTMHHGGHQWVFRVLLHYVCSLFIIMQLFKPLSSGLLPSSFKPILTFCAILFMDSIIGFRPSIVVCFSFTWLECQ